MLFILLPINSLIKTFLANIHNQFPDIKRVGYDFRNGQFVRVPSGLPLDISAIMDIRRGKFAGMAAGARAGEATLRRAILIQSIASSESSERPRLLENLLTWNGKRLAQNGLGKRQAGDNTRTDITDITGKDDTTRLSSSLNESIAQSPIQIPSNP